MKRVFILFLMFVSCSFGAIVSVSAYYDIKASPDIAIVNIGLIEQSKDPTVAMETLFKRANALIKSLKGYNITTTSFSLNPIYDKKGNIMSFRAFEGFKIKMPIKRLSYFFNDIKSHKIDTIESISFDISNKRKLRLIAIKKAMKLAKDQASAALSGTRYNILGIKSCSVNIDNYPRPVMFFNTLAMHNAPIKSGDINIGVTVNVVYNIGE